MVRAIAFYQCGLGLTPARCDMSVEFVVGSSPFSEDFSLGSPAEFLPFTKTNNPNSNSTQREDPHECKLRLMRFPL